MRTGRPFVEFEPTWNGVATRAGGATAGAQDGDGAAAGFTYLMTAASDGTFLFVSDNGTIRRVGLDSPWSVTTILGEPGLWGSLDGAGPAARLGPYLGLQIVGTTLYVADGMSAAVRTVNLSEQPYAIITVAGTLGATGTDDGVGAAARFWRRLPWRGMARACSSVTFTAFAKWIRSRSA